MNHSDAWDLIPWLVNDSIDDAQRGPLERHLTDCGACRDEMRAQQALLQAMQAPPLVAAMPRASLQKLWLRLDAESIARPGAITAPPSHQTPTRSWRIAAAASVVLALGAGMVGVVRPQLFEPSGSFRTVSDPRAVPAAGTVRAVFTGSTTVVELQALLEHTGLGIVAGPTTSGVYTLAPASAATDAQAALATLRAHPAVRFAEPVDP
jgi:hypothetical protein